MANLPFDFVNNHYISELIRSDGEGNITELIPAIARVLKEQAQMEMQKLDRKEKDLQAQTI